MKKNKLPDCHPSMFEHSLWYTIWTTPIDIIFTIFLYIIASICYLVEHLYNLCRGKGWTGLPLI